MGDVLPYKKAQEAEIASLQVEAARIGSHALSASTILAASKSAEALMSDGGLGALGEAASDLMALRTDSTWMNRLNTDIAESEDAVSEFLHSVLGEAVNSELRAQKSMLRGMSYTITSAEYADMWNYPVQGHTISEMTHHLHDGLRYSVLGIAASPLTGDMTTGSVVAELEKLNTSMGASVARATAEVYLAGTQMAMRMIAEGLGRAY